MSKTEPPPDCPECKTRPLPPGYEHYTFSDDDGCPCVSANVRLTKARGVFTHDEAQEHYDSHPSYREARTDLAVAEGLLGRAVKAVSALGGAPAPQWLADYAAWLKERGE